MSQLAVSFCFNVRYLMIVVELNNDAVHNNFCRCRCNNYVLKINLKVLLMLNSELFLLITKYIIFYKYLYLHNHQIFFFLYTSFINDFHNY